MTFDQIFIGTTGAMERQTPLPPRRYWVDVFSKDSERFTAWLKAHADTVHVRSTEHIDAGGHVRDWVLFDVSAPTPWEGPGFPTIAGPEIKSSADTAQRPPPASASDILGEVVPSPGTGIKTALTAAVIFVGGLIIFQVVRR